MVPHPDGVERPTDALAYGPGLDALRWCRARTVRRAEQAQNETKQAILL
ncbi:hypothetical protein ACFRAR_12320 [Kitasatospora sp. NPDC056651]